MGGGDRSAHRADGTVQSQTSDGAVQRGSGTLASLGRKASEVRDALMEDLGLGNPVITWHSSRDNLVEFTAILSMIAGTLAKVTHEIVLMQRTEIGELEEKFGEGQVGSSTMPQKRNPMSSEQVIAVARSIRALAGAALEGLEHEDERDSAAMHTEWHFVSEGCILTAGMPEPVHRDSRKSTGQARGYASEPGPQQGPDNVGGGDDWAGRDAGPVSPPTTSFSMRHRRLSRKVGG